MPQDGFKEDVQKLKADEKTWSKEAIGMKGSEQGADSATVGGLDPEPETPEAQLQNILQELSAAAKENRRASATVFPVPLTAAAAVQTITSSAPYKALTGSMHANRCCFLYCVNLAVERSMHHGVDEERLS